MIRDKLLIEIGAFDGSDSLKYYNEGYKVFTFEPNKILYENLVNITKDLENYTIIPKAVYNENGKTSFNICKAGGASSILNFKDDDELNKNWGENRYDIHYSGETYEVETIRLDTFIEENLLQDKKIDFIHIDAQGVDLEVLMSLGKYLNNVEAGVLETVIDLKKSIYIEQNLNSYDNVNKFLTENGFVIKNVSCNDVTSCEYNVYFEKKTKISGFVLWKN